MSKAILLALLSDLLTPILIWKTGLPAEVRWLSSGVLAAVLLDGYARMLQQRRFPAGLWIIVALSVVGIPQALLNGQSLVATMWGWWLMFRYPFVGLYAYLQPRWPEQFPSRLLKWGILLLCFEVAVQLAQYATGEPPGDNLAGSLGIHGTGNLVLVVLLVFALVLGQWIARGGLARVALVLALGATSSVLGEMKVFFFAAGFMAVMSLAIHLWQKRQLVKLLPYAFLLAAVLAAFPPIYNSVVPGAEAIPFSEYFDPAVLARYMNGTALDSSGNYDVGRLYAVTYAWDQISGNPISLAFGDGLGARGESQTLGSAGVALLTGDLGLFTGSSLVVMMGELGMFGLLSLSGFFLWVARMLWKGATSGAASDAAGIQYGALIYTLLWPLWLWYDTSWSSSVAMLLYWSTLGYCLARLRRGEPGKSAARPFSTYGWHAGSPIPVCQDQAAEQPVSGYPAIGSRN